jgi:hypothetical protein
MLIVFCYLNCREAIVCIVHVISKNVQCHTIFVIIIKVTLTDTHIEDLTDESLNSSPQFLHNDWAVIAGR